MPEENLTIQVSAPGKVILHGEHSVVYGKMALATSLNRRTYVTIKSSPENLILNFPNINLTKIYKLPEIELLKQQIPTDSTKFNWQTPEAINHDTFINQIVNYLESTEGLTHSQKMAHTAFFYIYIGLLSNFEKALKPIKIEVTSELKLSSGSGSSASFCVALTGALIQLIKKLYSIETGGRYNEFTELEKDVISRWALAAEKIMHGTPSGIDTTICSYGSFIEFRRNHPIKNVPVMQELRIMLIDTNVPRDSKKLILGLRELHSRHPSSIDNIFNAMDDIAFEALNTIIKINELSKSSTTNQQNLKQQYLNLQELFSLNHGLLRTVGVSHPSLEHICEIVASFNLVAKLTGAGGGGYAVVIIPPDCTAQVEQDLSESLTKAGFDVLVTSIGTSGVQVEQ